MTYFSRLSDIISCRLEDLLASSPEPGIAIGRIVIEIEEGLAGARRSTAAAEAEEQRLRLELAERQAQIGFWAAKAREELAAGNEASARSALFRKQETADLVAALELQVAAAVSTREHLTTTARAIEARLAEAVRRQQELGATDSQRPLKRSSSHRRASAPGAANPDMAKVRQVEAEFEALKRELGK
jgi:phage shock protein A